MFCGHANPAIVRAIKAQAERSTQFLLPTEASVQVAEELARRYPCRCGSSRCRLARPTPRRSGWRGPSPAARWSFCARATTTAISRKGGRPRGRAGRGPGTGLSRGVTGRGRIAQFNGVDRLAAALEPGDVAMVLSEPAMTNRIHLLAPEPGWHDALRAVTSRHGTLRAVVRPAAADRRRGLLPRRRGPGPVAADLARQPRGVGGPARRRPDGPLRAGVRRAAGDADPLSAG
jgi:glutamate-1-semialdehyde 2,1-aminomutase